MGLFKDLWNLRKRVKELEQGEMGSSSGLAALGEIIHESPGMVQQGLGALEELAASQGDVARLVTAGVDGTATFVAARETGMSVGPPGFEQALADLDLDVSLPGYSTYRATVRQLVPRLSLGQLAPGAQLPVKVDPVDHHKLMVMWGGVLAAGMAATGWPGTAPATPGTAPGTSSPASPQSPQSPQFPPPPPGPPPETPPAP